ncbi:MAG: GNAT family N-acetyltransferase [Planctomycetota bacterium]
MQALSDQNRVLDRRGEKVAGMQLFAHRQRSRSKLGTAEAGNSSTKIRLATSGEDLAQVYRFRYKIYIEEMERRQLYANHSAKCIVDPLDKTGYTLAAWKDGQVVATVRNNHFGEEAATEYTELYGLPCKDINSRTVFTTRLMVAPSFRRGTLATRVCIQLYREALSRGTTTAYLDCNSHLVDYFAGLGYRTHLREVEHREYGTVAVMRLDLHDIEYLRRIRSPFRRACSEFFGLEPNRHSPRPVNR